MSTNSKEARNAAIRHIIRGMGTLEHCGEHPGNFFLVALILGGGVTGAHAGWLGALFGSGIMVLVLGPLYLWGAYDRSKAEDYYERRSKQNTHNE